MRCREALDGAHLVELGDKQNQTTIELFHQDVHFKDICIAFWKEELVILSTIMNNLNVGYKGVFLVFINGDGKYIRKDTIVEHRRAY